MPRQSDAVFIHVGSKYNHFIILTYLYEIVIIITAILDKGQQLESKSMFVLGTGIWKQMYIQIFDPQKCGNHFYKKKKISGDYSLNSWQL